MTREARETAWDDLDEDGLARELAPLFVDVLARYDLGFDVVVPLLLVFVDELCASRGISALTFATQFLRWVQLRGEKDMRAEEAATALLHAARQAKDR